MERKSKYLLAPTVSRKAAALVGDAMQNLLRSFSALVLPLTCDNGKEFAGQLQIAQALHTDIFSARPYRSGASTKIPAACCACSCPRPSTCARSTRNGCRKPSTGSTTALALCLATAPRTRSPASTGSRPASTRHPQPRTPVLSDRSRNAAPPRRTFPLSRWRPQPASAPVVRSPFRARSRCGPRVAPTAPAVPC